MEKIIKNKKREWRALCLFIFLCLIGYNAEAGYNLIAPNVATPEVSVVSASSPTWLNNAVFTNSNGTVYTEVWDEGGGNGVWAEVHDNGGHSFKIHLGATVVGAGGSVRNPDVILGGDANNTYFAAVYTGVAGLNSDIFLEVYTITGVNTNSFASTSCTPHTFQVTGTHRTGVAHIDVAFEMVGLSYPTADVFVIAWEDAVPTCAVGGQPGARACKESLSHIANCNTPSFTYSPNCLNHATFGPTQGAGVQVDIAVAPDYNNGGYLSTFTYTDPAAGNLFVGTWNLGTTLVQVGNMYAIGNPFEWPRIDMYDSPLTPPAAHYEIVYRYQEPYNNVWNIVNQDPLSTNEITGTYTPFGTFDYDNSKPVVTAGTEDLAGNTHLYSAAYQNSNLGEIMEENIVVGTGLVYQSALSDDFRIVNNNTVVDAPVAISSSYAYNATYSKMQPDEIYVCWYNTGGTIDCKTRSSAPPVFKHNNTGNSNNVLKPVDQFATSKNPASVYPLPANDILHVKGNGRQLKAYTITDVLGKVLQHGDFNADQNNIDISSLSSGLYLLNINYKDAVDVDGFKVTKE
ncbi:MAG: T9SS type A sorting domain-containing protein [Bacteroidetes bacterium]|nr:T9SS type A sorting domain-containing protein [Bacteroidota bacterium]